MIARSKNLAKRVWFELVSQHFSCSRSRRETGVETNSFGSKFLGKVLNLKLIEKTSLFISSIDSNEHHYWAQNLEIGIFLYSDLYLYIFFLSRSEHVGCIMYPTNSFVLNKYFSHRHQGVILVNLSKL